ncbi:hypothetical protein BOTBODRAFT_255266 [Botryobasidium botryosum FD-172 SS1]|uniref:HTH La-type RNA-binding domain-containing protein n=1 Tax=Botryobasidium botryosum (strain FD-172 SS1) TaxID=930990 RepID=A0A067M455_BOTB1|nr:hypothetical protein BOTBODRAFT_255266 [Botryobasidium botryosum FD-172 SS1]
MPNGKHIPNLAPAQTKRLHHRPTPSQSDAVGGWSDIPPPASPSRRPIFGSVDSANTAFSPRGSALGLDVAGSGGSVTDTWHASEADFVPRPRGRLGIGMSNGPEQDDGWFVVDGRSGSDDAPARRKWEFGKFTEEMNKSGGGSSRSSSVADNVPSQGYGRGARETNSNNINGHGGYGGRDNSGGRGRVGHRGQGRGPHGGNRGNGGYGRGHRENHHYRGSPRQHGPHQYQHLPPAPFYPDGPSDSYMPPPPDTYSPMPYYPGGYMPPPFVNPYLGYPGGYPIGMPMPPLPIQHQSGATTPSSGPPLPAPVTNPGFPLDPLRYHLLGQIEYYFSFQNLVSDLFLKQQVSSSSYIELFSV